MNDESNSEARPRIVVMPYLEALEYDAAYHLHRGQPVMQTPATYPELLSSPQEAGNGNRQVSAAANTPKVLPWRRYVQAQGRRMGTAGAGLGLLVVGGLALLGGVACISQDVEVYIACQPKSADKHSSLNNGMNSHQPVGNLPHADNASDEEELTGGKPLPASWLPWCLFHLTFFPLVIYGCIWAATACLQKAEETEVGVPLTSANTGHLPAVESLVRASGMPTIEPATLVRAANPQVPPEQMLRPAAYTEEKLPEQLVRSAE